MGNSVKVEVLGGNTEGINPHPLIITRPQTTGTLNDVPSGNRTLRIRAFASNNGAGVCQAEAQKTFNVRAGQNNQVQNLTFNSTVDSVEVAPSPQSVAQGATVEFTATARDATGAVILVPTTGAFTWSIIIGAAYATVDTQGTVTGVAERQATVQALENESGEAGQAS